MFGLFKKSSNTPDNFKGKFKSTQKEFLLLADSAYLLTFKQMDMAHIAKYVSRELYISIYNSLTLERPWSGVSDKFKTTTWTLLSSSDDGSFSASKETVFDKVNVSRQLKISVADDYKEVWTVSKRSTGEYIVESIV